MENQDKGVLNVGNRNRSRRGGLSRKNLTVICCVLVLILAALIVVAVLVSKDRTPGTQQDSQETQQQTQQQTESSGTLSDLVTGPMEEMTVYSVEEQDDVMFVTTSYCDFSYSYAFSDLVVIEPVNEETRVGLAFFALIEGKNEPVYTLWINSDQGIPAGSLHAGDKTYRVSMELMDPSDDLNEEYLTTFYAVQETMNDVLLSLAAGGSFDYSVGGNS